MVVLTRNMVSDQEPLDNGFINLNVQKGVFIDGHECADVIEYHNQFLTKMEALKPSLVEFEESSLIKPKTYPDDCAIKSSNRQSVILITHNKSTFNANNSRQQVWQKDDHSTLRSKGKEKRIIVSDFL